VTVTAAGGFRAAGVAAGLKASGARDVAVVVNDGPTFAAAGVVTINRVKAAPVLWTEQVLTSGQLRAVVLNAGGANACTGPDGFADTHRTAEYAAETLGCGAGEIAICSTGLIGERLPMTALLDGVGKAVAALSADGGNDAADAIRTTDSVSKTAVARAAGVTVGGMAKGAGMLAPGMATMLCVLTTDAVATPAELDAMLRDATRTTFDRVDTDGCMSTNDTVLLLASGASGVAASDCGLHELVVSVCADLAGQLVADAEGASKDVTIDVVHAATEDDAVEVGRAVARSALLKCALYGNDPNWGRVLAAVGTTSAVFEPDELDVAINNVWVCRNGAAAEDRTLVDMTPREVSITVDLNAGAASATIRTTDLTVAYVHENSAYST
jgi:glutamate N-acetyltransferase/amino-acid N-acetyltransferase